MIQHIGIAGVGRMGMAMAERLIACERSVAVWNRTRAKAEAAGKLGAIIAETPRDLAAGSDCVISIVTEDNGARALYCGGSGLLEGAAPGAYFIEMSTLQPATAREIAYAVARKGCHFISAPVLGTVVHVAKAQLVVLASGRNEDVDAVRGVLELMARKVIALGDIGSGAAMKLAVNLVLGVYLEAVTEALALGSAEGLEVNSMLEVLAESPLANLFLTFKTPILRGEAHDVAFDIKSLSKDLSSAVAAASGTGVSLPAATAALSSLKASVAAGWADRDIAELPRFYRENMALRW
jgi:3-hydroxyisobutyrate dehydrogenase